MSVFMVFRIALKALGRNKLRTALTMLGMIIGVGAVIAKVALLGSTVRDQLFGPDVDPTGQVIRIGNQPFTVAGVMAVKGQTGVGQDQDDVVFVPYTTVMKKMRGIRFIQQITVSATSAATTSQTADAIAAEMRVRHKIQPGDPD